MNITKVNQEKIIEFIAGTLSKVEKEEYRVMSLNTSNIVYKKYGAPEIRGNLVFIGNSNFIKRVKHRYKRNPNKFLKSNLRYKMNSFKKLIDNESKGIIIEYTDTQDNEPYIFKRAAGINNDNYAYLNSMLDAYNYHKDSNPNKHINMYLNSFDYISTSKYETKKKLVKTLNGKIN